MTKSKLSQEFAKLVHDVRLFIQQDIPPSITPILTKTSQAPEAKPLPKHVAPPQQIALQEIRQVSSIPPSEMKGGWFLQPMSPPTEGCSFRQKLAKYVHTQDPPCRVLLVLAEENSVHRLFLENVSRAITRTFASARVVLYHEGLWSTSQNQLILAHLSLCQKKFPKAQVHVPLLTCLPLENLDTYTHDVKAKRDLWMSIQRMFQS